jgi:Sec-independent protein translocase protein TatA
MNILGLGGPEFLIIVIIMMLIAGPQRMVRWMYVLGTYIAKFRRMWSETVDVLQEEFDEAGVGIQLPKEVPTRANIRRQAAGMLGGVAAPIKETMDQVNKEVNQIGTATKEAAQAANASTSNGHSTKKSISSQVVHKRTPPAPKETDSNGFGTWSGPVKKSGSEKKSDFGSWTKPIPPADKTDKEE